MFLSSQWPKGGVVSARRQQEEPASSSLSSNDYLGELFRHSGVSGRLIEGGGGCSNHDKVSNSNHKASSSSSLCLEERLETYLGGGENGGSTTDSAVGPVVTDATKLCCGSISKCSCALDAPPTAMAQPPSITTAMEAATTLLFCEHENKTPAYAYDAFHTHLMGTDDISLTKSFAPPDVDDSHYFSGEVPDVLPDQNLGKFPADYIEDVAALNTSSLLNRFRNSNSLLGSQQQKQPFERYRYRNQHGPNRSGEAESSSASSASSSSSSSSSSQYTKGHTSLYVPVAPKRPNLIGQIESRWLNSSSFQTSTDLWLLSKSIYLVTKSFCPKCHYGRNSEIDQTQQEKCFLSSSIDDGENDLNSDCLVWNAFNLSNEFQVSSDKVTASASAALMLNSRSLNSITAPISIVQASFILLAFVYELQKKESKRRIHNNNNNNHHNLRNPQSYHQSNNLNPFSSIFHTLSAALTFQSQLHHQSNHATSNHSTNLPSTNHSNSSSSLHSSCCTMSGFTVSSTKATATTSSNNCRAVTTATPRISSKTNFVRPASASASTTASTSTSTTASNPSTSPVMIMTRTVSNHHQPPTRVQPSSCHDNWGRITHRSSGRTASSLAATMPVAMPVIAQPVGMRPSSAAARGNVLRDMCARLLAEMKNGTQKSLHPLTSRFSGYRKSDHPIHRLRLSSRKYQNGREIDRVDRRLGVCETVPVKPSPIFTDRLEEQLCQSRDCGAVLEIIQRFCCALFVASAWVDEQEPLSTTTLAEFLASSYNILEESRPCCRSTMTIGVDNLPNGSPPCSRRLQRGANTNLSRASQLKKFAAATASTFYSSVTPSCLHRTSAVDLVRSGSGGHTGPAVFPTNSTSTNGSTPSTCCRTQESIHWSPPTGSPSCIICRDLSQKFHISSPLISNRLNTSHHERSVASPGTILPDRESTVRRFGATTIDFERNLFAVLASLDYKLHIDTSSMNLVSHQLLDTFKLASDTSSTFHLSSSSSEWQDAIVYNSDDPILPFTLKRVMSTTITAGNDYSCSTRIPSFPTSSTSLARRSTCDLDEDLLSGSDSDCNIVVHALRRQATLLRSHDTIHEVNNVVVS